MPSASAVFPLKRWIATPGRAIAVMLSIAAALALVMALLSALNDRPEQWSGPPDEYLHRSAARYYVDHWLPPKVGDAATLDSYSRDYGFSYLNETDVVYLFAGKFAWLISPLLPNHDIGFRLFNVMLLAALAGWCAWRPMAWLIFAPLALSPQIWYLFSYFNGDAFPLLLSMLIAYQVSADDSLFNRYLDNATTPSSLASVVLLGLLVALLALSKKNYYAFLAFLPPVVALARLGAGASLMAAAAALVAAGVYLEWFTVDVRQRATLAAAWVGLMLIAIFVRRTTRVARGVALLKILVLGVVALALTVPRYLVDSTAQGSLEQKNAAIGAVQEQLAKPDYKPSKIYSASPEAFRGFTLRARGVTLREMFAPPWNWHLATFLSATGHYGWLQFRSPTAYYVLIGALYALLFAYVAASVGRSKDVNAGISVSLLSIFAGLTVAVSIYHSWTNDFQAQGRYLFPVLGMLGICLQSARRHLNPSIVLTIVGCCFVLSVYSFVFTALWQIPKTI